MPTPQPPTAPLVAISMVALHPVRRLEAALDEAEAALQPRCGVPPLKAVLRLIDAGELVLGSPVAERGPVQAALFGWELANRGLMRDWGLGVTRGALRVTDPVQLGVQLASYPQLASIMFRRLVAAWRRALASAGEL